MKSIETEGKTVEQAIELALYKMGAKREDVVIQILDQGSLFNKAKVKVSSGEQTEGEMQILKFFNDFISVMGLNCFAAVEEKENTYYVNLIGEDVGVMIGKRGDVLAAIQLVVGQILMKGKHHDEYKRIVVDSSNYLERREESLKILARTQANKAIREKRQVKLDYMNARERRIIHTELANNERVETKSSGVEPKRYVVITPVKVKKQDKGVVPTNTQVDTPRDNND